MTTHTKERKIEKDRRIERFEYLINKYCRASGINFKDPPFYPRPLAEYMTQEVDAEINKKWSNLLDLLNQLPKNVKT